MGIEFLGNKRQLESFIIESIKSNIDEECTSCFDIFSGSGSVSAAFKKNGYSVIANDFLYFSSVLTASILNNDTEPMFEGVPCISEEDVSESKYIQIIKYLNSLSGKEGFIYKNYSPASKEICGVERMYFTESNAKKIDAIRDKIEEWDGYLTYNEKCLLISDLLKAVAAVSNIAGTYGCYMKYWKKKSLQQLELKPGEFVTGKSDNTYIVKNSNANDIIDTYPVDIVYADPPYTKRQYSAYYHILETIALNDNPVLEGSTGLRNWKQKASDYCYKRKAPGALEDLVSKARCKYFVLSYNNEGQIMHEKILSILQQHGSVSVYEQPYKRYKSNHSDTVNSDVIERVYILKMERNNA